MAGLNKVSKLFFVTLLVFLQAHCGAFALDSTPDEHASQEINLENSGKKFVSKIDFDEVLEKAHDHSYDLKIADFSVLVAKTGITSARSEYFPKLFLSASTEYTKNFRDVRETTVMSVGDSFINPYTRFQSVMGITLNYNLFDFGVRKGSLDIAKDDVQIQELKREEKLQELDLNLVDMYSKVLILKKQIEYRQEILALSKKNLEYQTRLFNAGELSKTELNDAAVKVENNEKKLNELFGMLSESLSWLSFYTGEDYIPEELKIADLKRSIFDNAEFNDYTKSITWRLKEIELKQKEKEIKVAKRMNYPKVNTYARYYLYGSDHNSYNDSLGNIEPSNFTIGGSVSMLAFDGFKNHANIQKVTLEYKQLQIERDQAIAQLTTRLATMRSNLVALDKQIENENKIIKELTDKQKSIHRLATKKLVTPIDENEATIELLEQKAELEKSRISSIAITKGIQILTTY